ncbi:MAG: amidotransferase [Verrucomicrobiota bacterium]
MGTPTLNLQIYQHVSYEGPCAIAEWANSANHILHSYLWPNTGGSLLNAPDALIIMGGPMNINEHDTYPWLIEEKLKIREFIKSGKPVLGICLGAQLIADAFDQPIFPAGEKELGWSPLTTTVEAQDHPLLRHFPQSLHVFHWHEDTFKLPPESTLLGSTEACNNQGFAIGSVVGLQFHIELSRSDLYRLVNDQKLPEWEGRYVSTQAEILNQASAYENKIRSVLFNLLDHWIKFDN